MNKALIIAELEKAKQAIARAYALMDEADPLPDPLLKSMRIASEVFEVHFNDLVAGGRQQRKTDARFAVMLLAKNCYHLTDQEIAEGLGGRDRSTVTHGIESARTLLEVNTAFAGLYEKCLTRLPQ